MPDNQPFYKNYLELLEDDEFLRWRVIPTEESDAYWHNLQRKYPMLHREIKRADDYLKNYVADKQELTEEDRKLLLNKIIRNVHQNRHNIRRKAWLWAASVAACAALLAGLFLLRPHGAAPFEPSEEQIVGNRLSNSNILLVTGDKTVSFEENVDIRLDASGVANVRVSGKNAEAISVAESETVKLFVPHGKRSQITLPDGSRVWLNSGSVLEFPSVFASDERAVSLTGEMYAEVARGNKRFVVHTAGFSVQVYGTSFNVSAYENSTEQSVVLVTGSVGVQTASGEEKTLEPNDMLTVSLGQTDMRKVNTAVHTGWKDGFLVLDNTPVSDILEQIGRYYNIRFDLANNVSLHNRRCRGKIFLSDNIDDTMTAISLLSRTEYSRDGNLIYIRKKNN